MKTYLDRDYPPFPASNRRRHRQIHQRAGTTSMFIQRGTQQRVHGRILWKRSTNLAWRDEKTRWTAISLENEDINRIRKLDDLAVCELQLVT